KNYPLRTEAGKGGCALYFSLNERAVIFCRMLAFNPTLMASLSFLFSNFALGFSIATACKIRCKRMLTGLQGVVAVENQRI
ncbi:MAG: hypothetical protein K2F78_03760, partial [Muribaculaceae bacterium]|nr:hypothetical protein [Muribaculaceae bacterium]